VRVRYEAPVESGALLSQGRDFQGAETARQLMEIYCLYKEFPGRQGVWRGTIYHAPWQIGPASLKSMIGWPALVRAAFHGHVNDTKVLQKQEPAVVHAGLVPGLIDFYMFELVK